MAKQSYPGGLKRGRGFPETPRNLLVLGGLTAFCIPLKLSDLFPSTDSP